MNLVPPPRRGDASPDLRPDPKGLARGNAAVSVYPERGSNPHPAEQEGILSHFVQQSASVQMDADRGENVTGAGHDGSALVPNEDRRFPDLSPELWERVRARVSVEPSGCWRWLGAKNSKGYACLRIGGRAGRTVTVHRLVLELDGRPLAGKQMACHTCNQRDCVNPVHLYVGDALSNAADARRAGTYKGRAAKGWETRRAAA